MLAELKILPIKRLIEPGAIDAVAVILVMGTTAVTAGTAGVVVGVLSEVTGGAAGVAGMFVDVEGGVEVVPPVPAAGFSVPVLGVVAGVVGDVTVTGGAATVGGATAAVLSLPPPPPPQPTKASAHRLPKTTARVSAGFCEKMFICIFISHVNHSSYTETDQDSAKAESRPADASFNIT
jgi:hypothetical protein